MQEFIKLVLNMNEQAGDIARHYFRSGTDVEQKSDESPVTIADKTIEEKLRNIIEKERPEDGFLGEEYGTKESQNGLMWVVDPIDGTKSFISGRPSFGTLIALWEGDTPLIGTIYQPITNELWLGSKGTVSTLNNQKIKTNQNANTQKLRIGSTSPAQFEEQPELLKELRKHADFFVWGGDCYLYGMLAFGGLDLVIETGLATYDYAAIPAIVEGAGGICSDWKGSPMTLDSDGNLISCANKEVQSFVLKKITQS